MRSARLAVVLDVACVLVFVVIGRASHGEGLIGVALAFLGLFLLGWRLLGRLGWLGWLRR